MNRIALAISLSFSLFSFALSEEAALPLETIEKLCLLKFITYVHQGIEGDRDLLNNYATLTEEEFVNGFSHEYFSFCISDSDYVIKNYGVVSETTQEMNAYVVRAGKALYEDVLLFKSREQ